MDAFLAPLDPARIVRAQAVGPRTAPSSWSRDLTGPGSTTFAAVADAGSYRVYLACVGDDVTLDTTRADAKEPANTIPITCDGQTTARDLGLGRGDAVSITATAPVSWRFALLAPARPALHAESVETTKAVEDAAGPRQDGEAHSASATPAYDATAIVTADVPVMDLSIRDAYRIAFSCAGPGPLTYRLQSPPFGVTDPVEPAGAALASLSTTVECDGGVHVDVVRFPFSIGAGVWVDAPQGTAWRMSAAFEDPPIANIRDGGGWKMGFGLGPNLWLDPQPDHTGLKFAVETQVRLAITCRGGESVDVTLRNDETGEQTSGTAPCAPGKTTVTLIPVAFTGRSFTLDDVPHGGMWLAITLQQSAIPLLGR
jgi:hypothetical protein